MPTKMNRAIVGALAGCVATLPMTVVMETLHRRLPASHRHPLPPRWITMEAVRPTRIHEGLDESERIRLTLASHFAYGAAMGTLYSALFKDALPLPSGARGVTYGLSVWAGSYLGFLPAAGLYPPATEEPAPRNALMIAAHVVWGASLDLILGGLATMDGNQKTLRPSAAPSLPRQHDEEKERLKDGEMESLSGTSALMQ